MICKNCNLEKKVETNALYLENLEKIKILSKLFTYLNRFLYKGLLLKFVLMSHVFAKSTSQNEPTLFFRWCEQPRSKCSILGAHSTSENMLKQQRLQFSLQQDAARSVKIKTQRYEHDVLD